MFPSLRFTAGSLERDGVLPTYESERPLISRKPAARETADNTGCEHLDGFPDQILITTATVALRGYSNIACYYRYNLLSSNKLSRWGAGERRFHCLSAGHGSSRPMSHRAAGVLVVARPPSCRFFAETGSMGGRRPLGKAWSVANAPLGEGADVDIDLEANRAGGRETAGADLYIPSMSEHGRGGLIPESTEFGSLGGGAANLSLLPPSRAASRPCWRYG
jgi:hypothetical protein